MASRWVLGAALCWLVQGRSGQAGTGRHALPVCRLAHPALCWYAVASLCPNPHHLTWPCCLAACTAQDGGNLGTLCRSALALGWQAVVLLPGCCDPFNDKAIRASRGAVFKLPLAQCSLEHWERLVEAHGLVPLAAEPDRGGGGSARDGRAAAAAAAGRQQQQEEAAGDSGGVQQRLAELRVCLCLGAEGQGLSPEVLQRCRPVSIPQAAGAQLMESLNVAAAGAILMFALSRGAAPLLAELAAL